MPALRILILSDGRPGHFHLSDGIAAAIGRRRGVQILRCDVDRGGWPGVVAAVAVNSRVADPIVLQVLSGHRELDFPAADLIVSAGAETLPANVLLARMRRIPNIFYGSLRRFRPEDFALVLTSYERNAAQPNHALALKPSATDPDTVCPGRTWSAGAPIRTAGLLVGGDSGTFTYADADWQNLLRLLEACHAASGLRWLVSNSRRTADAVSDDLARMAARPVGPIASFVDVRTAGSGTLHDIFARADAMVVTDDSSSMISEAIWMRLPVVGLRPLRSSHPKDEQIYRDWLARNGWCRSLPLEGLTPDRLRAEFDGLMPLAENPLDALARLIDERLPMLSA
jgi:mitochondrial fission protein ELM1